ncbi:MAG: ATP-binding cassette domain-containing protein [Phycisphaeraceae bacterium]|nr:ATP-binding cassette domain-containing protein [Phycisphaeraceae bacterium]MCW5754020.1 ATP-binding cassette domain-containing protein [Phycisphaeraceae bacterium]
MISVRDLHKSYAAFHAVRGITFDAPKGQVVGLLGPNGAGKTTTIRIITGYLPADRGSVSVLGADTLEDSARARSQIGYLPESSPLYPEMRTIDYLRFRARLFKVPSSRVRAAVEQAIDRCWLAEVRRKRIGHLSKGYKQRVGLAAAILHDPAVIILDEPTNGLDPSQIVEMRRLIRELGRDRTLLVSSHILSEVEKTCDRVVVIARGRVRADGPPGDLLRQASRNAPCRIEFLPPDDNARQAILAALGALPNVREVTLDTPSTSDEPLRTRCLLVPVDDADPREDAAALITRAGGRLREITRETATLEKVFMRAIEGDDA